MILIEESLFNKDICNSLVRLAIDNEQKARPFRDIKVFDLKDVNHIFTKKLINYFSNFLGKRGIIAYPEKIEITIWEINSKQDMHLDGARDTTNLTSITYLNDDYLGGETIFKNGIIVKPEIGKTVFFDGKKYLHGVSPITKGKRYVLAIWYTSDLNSIII